MDLREEEFITNRIKVFGIVQGVGFRPLVYHIAKKLGIHGRVRNVGGYVEILVNATKLQLDEFVRLLQEEARDGCEIVKLEIEMCSKKELEDFRILGSEHSNQISIIPPDLPTCSKCQKELLDEKDRRYYNPFISCMSCGPRFTILEELPYDRHHTTMVDFQMCSDCSKEYTTPEDRRFHAQTISCNDCGPTLIYQEMNRSTTKEKVSPSESTMASKALQKAIDTIKSGGILALKGIGGYHYVCSPFEEETVQRLRRLKGREEKPFAVMFEDLTQIEQYCSVSEEEKSLLLTKARPIVLLTMLHDRMAPSTNKGSIYCGAFIPYTPLQLLLIKACGPLIMTSANHSNQPIIREDKKLLSLGALDLDGVLYHKRRIIRSVDDSVAKIFDGKPQLIRRSRGYVPYPVFLEQQGDQGGVQIVAAGGDLKAAFCLYLEGSAVVSQHFGDLEEATVYSEYQKSYEDYLELLHIRPSLAVCDLHPNYYSSEFAKSLGIPVVQVQHHHAHIASVMAEHDLQGKVIGVAFDGTGYGSDGNIWGGEFLICEGATFERAGHLTYTPMLGGDASMKDARKTASCYLLSAGLSSEVKDERKDLLQAALNHKVNTILSSSVGRLFDAVASILTICQYNRYEGECAVLLEREATLALREGILPEELSFSILEEEGRILLDPQPVFKALVRLRASKDIRALALGFHYALAEAVSEISLKLRARCGSNIVALSGGVFQNTILSEQVLLRLRKQEFQVYVNLAVPPNDGGISLGQIYLGLKTIVH